MRNRVAHIPALLPKAAKIAALLIAVYGFIVVVAQIQPFWVDEWRLLYNLKFKTIPELFGPLRYTQQFPRVHLALLKCFTSLFDYSYFILRLPAYLTSLCSIALAWRLMNRIFGNAPNTRYLFLLIIISSHTFLKYLVQIKHYEMELFLSLVGIWQLLLLSSIGSAKQPDRRDYLLLCLSCAFAPFFSYTYPIVVAPVFLLLLIQSIGVLKGKQAANYKWQLLLKQWFPLTLCAIGIVIFYALDVSQVMGDEGMQCYWQEQMITGLNAKSATAFATNVLRLFGTPGSGDVFVLVFSVVGLCCFIYACMSSGKLWARQKPEEQTVLHYALLLIGLVILLFVAGKLPLGEARLSSFAVPAMAILIVHSLKQRSLRTRKLTIGISTLLYLALFGNVVTHIIHEFTRADYAQALKTYNSTEDAILYAKARQLPIVVTPGVAYPYDIVHDNACLEPMDPVAVLMTFPAYKPSEAVPVFSVPDTGMLYYANRISARKVVGDGIHYRVADAHE